ncbi:hypothetical protein G6F19_011162 [Rhizopus arrhizus]|nr:hypothetical protein G6F19_011162 [Rhizopus arrhizus]
MTLSLHGVFVPIPTFFKENEDLDLEALDQHIQFLANSGVSGVVVLGSMGEAVSLSDEERSKVIERVVESKNKYNPNLVIIAGTSSQSARNAVAYTKQAAAAGAQYALILPPSFYRGSITDEALIAFYTTVADQSPLPVIIYNYPGVCQGLDISVKVLAQLSKHKNIAGVKGTEGNVGKMANLAEKVNSEAANAVLPIAEANVKLLSWDDAYAKAKVLVDQMSLEQKVNITTGVGWQNGPCLGNTYAIKNPDFPSLCLQDAPLGIRFSNNVTSGVAGINAAASFDRKAIYERGVYLGKEFRGKGAHVLR